MRLTVELVEGAAQFTNPATRDREIDLRGYKIPQIENLGATLDQFDCMDLSDNDIKKLENFPLLKRLKKILLNNNRISKIADHLEESLPNLEWLILTNNEINSVDDIASLSTVKSLKYLTLLKNPIVTNENYRLSVIYHLPQLKVLDFSRIRTHERKAAAKQFKGSKNKKSDEPAVHEFVPGEVEPANKAKTGHTPEEIQAIKDAIAKASSLEEIERLNQALRSGYVPGTQ